MAQKNPTDEDKELVARMVEGKLSPYDRGRLRAMREYTTSAEVRDAISDILELAPGDGRSRVQYPILKETN